MKSWKRVGAKKGATMAELLVTFALLAIFLTSAAAIMTPATVVYQKIKHQSYARNVSDILMEKICGELAGASDAVNVVVADDGSAVMFCDSQQSSMVITLTDADEDEDGKQYLLLHYREVLTIEDGKVNLEEKLWDAVDWTYDKRAYQGFAVEELRFDVAAGGGGVKVSLKLRNAYFATEYSTTRTVECFNLADKYYVEKGTVYREDEEYYANLYPDNPPPEDGT